MSQTAHAFAGAEAPALVGESAGIVALRDDVAAAARTHAKVLVLGETGTGKEVVARLLHSQSPRRSRAFVAVNCSGIPETLLESELFGHTRGSFTGAVRDKLGLVRQADRGTLFLDELGEMSLRMQAVLLRFTETGEIQPVGSDSPTGHTDVRLVTATNRDLRQRIADGQFREDLFYRLNVIQIRIPPLRERGSDILLLMEHYLLQAAQSHRLRPPTLTPAACELLMAYAWPGNVRELRNVSERLVLQDRVGPVPPEALPHEIRDGHTVITGISASSSAPVANHTGSGARRDGPPVTSASVPTSAIAERLWQRMDGGEDFWAVVGQAFKAREVTRADLTALVDRGLTETRGSYRALLGLFNLPESDYKKFHAFLYQQRCNLPVAPYRARRPHGSRGHAAAPVPLNPAAFGPQS
jgi:DNA-binding NtrC family response regulator